MRLHLAPLSSLVAAIAVAMVYAPGPSLAAGPYTLFESGQVRPLALSPDGTLLFAANTPDNRVEVFRAGLYGPTHLASVAVGLEPVAIAARSNDEVWVVNHLSDSVSVLDVRHPRHPRVVRTLLVGDEPRDIVFAGANRSRAFITTAHRGQNSPVDPQLTTPGVGRADVWVFDAAGSPGDAPLTILTLFSDTPRALAASPDGARVYAAAFHSGNRTATAFFPTLPAPTESFEGIPQPPVSLIVRFNGEHWVDETGAPWDDRILFSLPDRDVFAIDAAADPPQAVDGPSGHYSGVGTVLFNMVVNPASGKIYVTNTEAFNEQRFEGPGIFAGHSARGHLHESRITVLGPDGVAPRHLNKHIDYATCCAPIPNPENEKSLAFPQGMAITGDGATLYVAALGSSKIGVFDTAALENDTFVPSTASQIPVSGGGPTGMVLDEPRGKLYVMTRFDNAISVINTATRAETAHIPMHNPEPPSVTSGRRLLYDAAFSSSHGDSACASCHVFGDLDSLAWDLGDPDGVSVNNPGPFIGPTVIDPDFAPMKGPMVTQSLRGMQNHGPMHWRGDRTGGNDAPTAQPDSGTFDEQAAFKKFRGAFPNLLGRSAQIPEADLQAFTDFALQITYPPNPIRNLDNSLTAEQQVGKDFYFGPLSFLNQNCNGCHVLDPGGNPGSAAPGFFGSDGSYSFANAPQMFKVPHLRNQYQKVGLFGLPPLPGFPPEDFPFMGDQIRGFGFTHDGVVDTIFDFMLFAGFSASADNPGGFPPGPEGDPLRRAVESFMLAFDSNLAPIVGQQVTLTKTNAAAAGARIDLLRSCADAGECDLVAKSRLFGEELGFVYVSGVGFVGDRQALPPLSDHALRLLPVLTGRELTYTCAPPGSGERIGVDRDGDGHRDGDESHAGSDPADPTSTPAP